MSGLSDSDKKKLTKAKFINDWRIYKMIPVGELQIPEYQRKAIRLQMLVKALYSSLMLRKVWKHNPLLTVIQRSSRVSRSFRF